MYVSGRRRRSSSRYLDEDDANDGVPLLDQVIRSPPGPITAMPDARWSAPPCAPLPLRPRFMQSAWQCSAQQQRSPCPLRLPLSRPCRAR